MVEKDYYAKITKYYMKRAAASMAIEVKITKTEAISFKCLAPHQEEFLLQSERVFAHKIPDVGMLKKPYDIMLVRKAVAILVVVYYRPRNAEIYEIPIRTFIKAREQGFRRSLVRGMAREIGTRIFI